MKHCYRFLFAAATLLLFSVPTGEACTSIMVGKKASSDGSVMTAHCCDSYYRTYVTIEPRKTFAPGEMEPYFFNVLHKEEPWDPRGVYETGRIATIYWDKTRKQLEPQVALFERMMFEQDRALQEKVKALPEEGREEAATRLLNDQTASFFSMVSGKWRELKGRVLEIFVRSM